ncbi:hypothetical protein M405DRAFT_867124 [Rhizopogon salebrosus TDB-379]|nr:hypothetical protein M405DRAFT_867124 [Rhizopogon salebrosus TDB-379]
MFDTLFAGETNDLFKRVHDATKILPGFGRILRLATEQNNELHRAQGKLQRFIERLRRACTRLLDGEAKSNSQMLISLLMVVCTVMEGVFKQNPSKDILTASLDSLFCLARVKLECNDPHAYTLALDLERAIILLDSAPGHMNVLSYGGAVRFLKEACALGARALHIRVCAMREDEEGGEQEEGWKQLDGQLFWRVGATCGVLFQVWGSKGSIHFIRLPVWSANLCAVGLRAMRFWGA